jgi:hypothetical protein
LSLAAESQLSQEIFLLLADWSKNLLEPPFPSDQSRGMYKENKFNIYKLPKFGSMTQ